MVLDDCVEYFPIKDTVKIKIFDECPFARGGLRKAYYGQEKQYANSMSSSVPISFHIPNSIQYKPKVFKEAIHTKSANRNKYVADIACQRTAIFWAREFNQVMHKAYLMQQKRDAAAAAATTLAGGRNSQQGRTYGNSLSSTYVRHHRHIPWPAPKVNFCDCALIQRVTRLPNQPYLHEEELLEGCFEKYNNNAGHVSPSPTPDAHTRHEIIQAFSHWTHVVTRGYLMVVDCQGVYTAAATAPTSSDRQQAGFMLTDPAIHCINLLRYGHTNHGQLGFQHFHMSHKCNHYCQVLKLTERMSSVTGNNSSATS